MIQGVLAALLVAAILPVSAFCAPADEVAQNQQDLFALFQGFRPAYEQVKDYTAKLHKEECDTHGRWHKEVLDFKFKKPLAVQIKWLEGRQKGREALFVEGKNNNKIVVKLSGLIALVFPKVRLSPKSELAKDESGHTIREAGLGYMMEELLKVTEGAHEKGELTLKVVDRTQKQEGPGHIVTVERTLSSKKGYPYGKLIIYVDDALHLPVGVDRYDAKGRLFAKYFYHDLKVNQDLKDEEFVL
ncbi:MAG: DUF1571 domain-containing protein [Candidatus Omnitrophica bacterium]|nr:DUF1571 domain-containing protein [Candidatus Omnitrophota bacterium]